MHRYVQSRRFSHQLSIRAGKTTLTKLKHVYSLTFWMVSLQAAAAPNMPAKEVTHGVLSPRGPVLEGTNSSTQDDRQGAERSTQMPMSIQPLPHPQGERSQGHLHSYAFIPCQCSHSIGVLLLFCSSFVVLLISGCLARRCSSQTSHAKQSGCIQVEGGCLPSFRQMQASPPALLLYKNACVGCSAERCLQNYVKACSSQTSIVPQIGLCHCNEVKIRNGEQSRCLHILKTHLRTHKEIGHFGHCYIAQ